MTGIEKCVSSEQLDKLLKKCENYITDESYVYKICVEWNIVDNGEWIVIMKKIEDTKTNEERFVVDKMHAKYRASELKVIEIINASNPEITKEFFTNKLHFQNKTTTYRVGCIVKPDFYNDDIKSVCSGGIHYFKTLESAFFYRNMHPINYTGIWLSWYDSGQKQYDGYFLNGTKTGKSIDWYENGQKCTEGDYSVGKKVGKWTSWHANGHKCYEREYIDNKLNENLIDMNHIIGEKKTGKWTSYYENGQAESEENYINNNKSGYSIEWYKNGKLKSIGSYINDLVDGNYIEFHENGKIKECGSYINGCMDGHWIYWYNNGQKRLECNYQDSFYNGEWIEMYENGKMKSECYYEHGIVIGKEIGWNVNGKKYVTMHYGQNENMKSFATSVFVKGFVTAATVLGIVAVGSKLLKLY